MCSKEMIKNCGGIHQRSTPVYRQTTANTCSAIVPGCAIFASAKPTANVMYPQPVVHICWCGDKTRRGIKKQESTGIRLRNGCKWL